MFRSLPLSVVALFCFLSFAAAVSFSSSSTGAAPAGLSVHTLVSGVTYGFDSLSLVGGYQYNPPTSAAQPFTWPLIGLGGGGVAQLGSPWDAAAPSTPPSPSNYAYLQTSGYNVVGQQLTNMSALATLANSANYYLTFFYSTRAGSGSSTDSTLTVLFNGVQVWSSVPSLAVLAGWVNATTAVFTSASNGVNLVQFVDTSASNSDKTVLIDSITITNAPASPSTAASSSSTGSGVPSSAAMSSSAVSSSATVSSTTASAAVVALSSSSSSSTGSASAPVYYLFPGSTYGFDAVNVNGFVYDPPVTATQLFTWPTGINLGLGGGGIAQSGSIWDPAGPSTPPSGSNYAFLQTSGNGAAGPQVTNMSVPVALIGGANFYITFFYATRAATGSATQSTLRVLVNGAQVWSSGTNLTTAGWQPATTSGFVSTNGGINLLQFVDTSSSGLDKTVLIDSITVVSGAPPAFSSATPSSSTSVGVSSSAALSSSAISSSATVSSTAAARSSSTAAVSSSAASTSTGRPAAGVLGDPQFIGLRGQSFQVHGIDGAVYALISEPAMQLNSRFQFLTGPRPCPVMPSTGRVSKACWSHDGSYLSELGVRVRETDEMAWIVAGDATLGFERVEVNGQWMLVNDTTASHSVQLISTHELLLTAGSFAIEVESVDGFVNLRSVRPTVPFSRLRSHGLLGQTWSSQRHGSMLRVIEGEVDDYLIDDDSVFGTQFVYNQYQVEQKEL